MKFEQNPLREKEVIAHQRNGQTDIAKTIGLAPTLWQGPKNAFEMYALHLWKMLLR